MEIIVGIVIAVLLGVIIYLAYCLKREKENYAYKSKKMDRLEENSSAKIEELEESVERLKLAAHTDITTKIGNREYFIDRMLEILEKKPNKDFTLVGFGIANIGTVNRLYGPAEGDRLVRYVADTLKQNYQSMNCALVQSNMFSLLVESQEDEKILEIIEQLTKEVQSFSDMFPVELRFGIYKLENKKERISEMLSRMVLAQRSVGKDAKNYAYFDEELNQQYEENKKMCAEMEAALEAKKFVMYLQPMVDLHVYKISSAEALVRWEHETKGLLSPYAFLPVFENTNLILKLDYYMWEEACKTIRRWIDNKMETVSLMVNISPVHLSNPSFITILNGLVSRYKLEKSMLVLELPEKALTSGGKEALDTVRDLDKEGYQLCIDNFGGLHSPVNLLRDLPFTRVKLDRKFLFENMKNEEGQTILRYLIAMAKELDMTVLTEGVETIEQINFLTEIGCDVAQGYYFSKPVDLREFDKINKKIKRHGFQPNQYYPTFTDLENGVDLMEMMMQRN